MVLRVTSSEEGGIQATEQSGTTSVTGGEGGITTNQQPGFQRIEAERPAAESAKEAETKPATEDTKAAPAKEEATKTEPAKEAATEKKVAEPSAFEKARLDLADDFLNNNGSLTDDAVKKAVEAFKDTGFTEQDIRIYEAGLKAQMAETYKDFGGFDQFKQFLSWAEAGMAKNDQDLYNDFLNRAEFGKAGALANTYRQKWQAATGDVQRRDITEKANASNTAPSGAVQGYASQAEMKKDMGDPRYAKDSAFRAMVAKRMAAS
jgi:hypothetical protein